MSSPADRKEHRSHDRAGLHGTAHVQGAAKKQWNSPKGEDADGTALHPRDPAYDSEGEDAARASGVRLQRVADDPMARFKTQVVDMLREYLTSESVDEAVRSLQELHEDAWLYEAVKQMVLYGLEQHDRERELISRLLAALRGGVVTADDVQRGFQLVLARLPDAVLDNPGAELTVGKFIARAVHDEALVPAFVVRATADSAVAKAAMAEARVLLEGPGAGARVQRVWGDAMKLTHSGRRLRAAFRALLLEYLNSADLVETERALRELHVPGVLFAFVCEALCVALEKSPAERARLSTLLGALHKSGALADGTLVAGVRACVSGIADLAKDVTPRARDLLLEMLALGVSAGYVPAAAAEAAAADTARLLEADRAAASQSSSAAALAAVRARTAELQAALTSGEAAKIAALFAARATLLPAQHKGEAVEGQEAIGAHLHGLALKPGEALLTVTKATSLGGTLLTEGTVRFGANAGSHLTLWLPAKGAAWTISKFIWN